jgi:hypothetical protein
MSKRSRGARRSQKLPTTLRTTRRRGVISFVNERGRRPKLQKDLFWTEAGSVGVNGRSVVGMVWTTFWMASQTVSHCR